MTSVPLESVVTIVGGGTPSKSRPEYYATGTIAWVTPKDMKSWEITDAIDRITQAALEESTTRLVPKDSVLLVVRSGVLKHSLPIAINRVPVALNQDMKALICDSTVLPEYLARFLQWSAVRILSQVRATTADNLPVDGLRKLRLSLPPLPEQRRIAALLDKADAIRRKRQQAIRLADDLLRSVFLDMFGDPVTNPRRWPGTLLGEVSDIQGGLQVTSARLGRPLDVPYLRVANVYRDRLDLTEVKRLRVTGQELTRAALKSGDLLVVEGHGNPEEIGRSAVWGRTVVPCVHQNHLIRVRVHSGIEPVFVSALLNSAAGRRQMRNFGKTTSGLNTISTANVAAVRVLVPPVEVQRRYVAFAGLLATLVRRLEASQRLAEENMKGLAHGVFGTERQPT